MWPDGGGEGYVVALIDSDGTDEWRNIRFECHAGLTGFLKATNMAYDLRLRNVDVSARPTANPEVDFIGFQFMPAEARRRQWYMRTVCSDGQARLDGEANPLDTRAKLRDKLQELWAKNGVLAFWEASPSGDEPDDADAVLVTMSNFADQPWRVSTTSQEVVSEASFSLLEINPTPTGV